MRKSFILILFWCCCSLMMTAQQNKLEIKGSGSNLYIEHIVVPKENFYSISRTYNVPPRYVASYNKLQFENGLNVGQAIRIPLTDNNFLQPAGSVGGEAMVPVYHSVEPKEGLYRISVNYNKVPLASLKSWNNLPSDAVNVGTALIVGFLRVDKEQSRLAGATDAGNVVTINAETTKAEEAVDPGVKPEQAVAPKEIAKDAVEDMIQSNIEQAKPVAIPKAKSNINFSGGYFKALYNEQVENKSVANETGRAGIFKSTSGWQDGKYYCFNNEALPGTVLKITDNVTGKSVFTKVLDAIPAIKQNEGLAVIVSNSAADELGAGENRFECAISFVKE